MTPAVVALRAAGVVFTVHEYAHDPRSDSFGLEAADELGLDPDRVYKTLMASADGPLVVAVVPVSQPPTAMKAQGNSRRPDHPINTKRSRFSQSSRTSNHPRSACARPIAMVMSNPLYMTSNP